MELKISAKNLNVSDRFRDYVEEKAGKIDRYAHKPEELHIKITRQEHSKTAGSEDHDPSEIVIDEVVGQWIALLPLSIASWRMGMDITVMWPGWIAAFALFRLFDIWKPWIIGFADRRGDALGVMLDDVFAGIFAAIGVLVLAGAYHAF